VPRPCRHPVGRRSRPGGRRAPPASSVLPQPRSSLACPRPRAGSARSSVPSATSPAGRPCAERYRRPPRPDRRCDRRERPRRARVHRQEPGSRGTTCSRAKVTAPPIRRRPVSAAPAPREGFALLGFCEGHRRVLFQLVMAQLGWGQSSTPIHKKDVGKEIDTLPVMPKSRQKPKQPSSRAAQTAMESD
jgi:hypothetical protein